MSRKIYEIRGRRSRFAYLFQKPGTFKEFPPEPFDGRCKPEGWQLPPLYKANPDRAAWDIGNILDVSGLVVTERSYNLLGRVLSAGRVQPIKFTFEDNQYRLLNALDGR